MAERRRRTPPWVVFAGCYAALIGTAAALYLAAPQALWWLTAKQGPAEWATLAVLVGALATALAWSRRGALFVLWSVGAALFLLEETSWLRDLVPYEAPAWFAVVNVHGDTNFHNRTAGGFDLMLLHEGFLYAYFLLVPLALTVAQRLLGLRWAWRRVLPAPWLGLAFAAGQIVLWGVTAAVPRVPPDGTPSRWLQEWTELGAALLVLFTILDGAAAPPAPARRRGPPAPSPPR